MFISQNSVKYKNTYFSNGSPKGDLVSSIIFIISSFLEKKCAHCSYAIFYDDYIGGDV